MGKHIFGKFELVVMTIVAFGIVSISTARAESRVKDFATVGIPVAVPSSPEKITPLKIGESVPDASIKSPNGKKISLSSVLKDHTAVVIFYRGGWCPYCNTHLGELNRIEEQLRENHVRLIALSPDRPEKVIESRKKQKVGYELYSDSSMAAARAFGVAFKLDDATVKKYKEKYNIDIEADSGQTHHQLPVPAAFVVGKDGKIVFAHSNADYKVRIKPEKLLTAVKKAVQ